MHVATWCEAIVDEQYRGTRDCTIRSIEMSTGANINVIFHVKTDIDGKFRGFYEICVYIFFIIKSSLFDIVRRRDRCEFQRKHKLLTKINFIRNKFDRK